MTYYNPHITGWYNPLYTLNNQGFFHCSGVNNPRAWPDLHLNFKKQPSYGHHRSRSNLPCTNLVGDVRICNSCLDGGHFLFLRTFQQTPGAYPKPPTNSLWRSSFHLGVWGCLGYAPGVCWGSLRLLIRELVPSWGWIQAFLKGTEPSEPLFWLEGSIREHLMILATQDHLGNIAHRIHVSYSYPHLPQKSTKCR